MDSGQSTRQQLPFSGSQSRVPKYWTVVGPCHHRSKVELPCWTQKTKTSCSQFTLLRKNKGCLPQSERCDCFLSCAFWFSWFWMCHRDVTTTMTSRMILTPPQTPRKGNLLHVKVRLFGSGYLPKHTLYFGREELHFCHDLGLNSRQMTRQVSSVHCRIL